MRFIDLTGQKFGRLTVIERAPSKGNRTMWLCRCDCDGKIVTVAGGNLKNGHTRSCGCLNDEKRSERKLQHGMSDTPLYETWLSRLRRCYVANCPTYHDYGARGIKVCERWHDFSLFYNDVSKMPHFGEPGYSLDRVDNDGDYEPSNCRWATNKEQSNNRRSNIVIKYCGKEQTLKQWADELGLNYEKTRKRIRDRNWSVEKAFTTP